MREELARLLDGLTGTVHFDDADPRWDSLLRCGERVLGLSLSEAKVSDFCDSMVRNNPKTGNFGSLLALTATAVDEAVSNAVSPGSFANNTTRSNGKTGAQQHVPHDNDAVSVDAATDVNASANTAILFTRALAALRLTRLFAARMVATLDASELRAQVYARGRRGRGNGDGGGNGGAEYGGVRGRGGVRGGHHGDAMVVGPITIVRSQGSGQRGVSAVAITEGREEKENATVLGKCADGDPVVALLASLMALCVAEQEEGEGEGEGGVAMSVEGLTGVQLEGVSLLLVLLGTQVYGPPPTHASPSSWRPPSPAPQASGSQDNVFMDALLREARAKRGGAGAGGHSSWGVSLSRAALGWFIRRPGAAPGSAASALVNALCAPPPSTRLRRTPSIPFSRSSADANGSNSSLHWPRNEQQRPPSSEYESLPTHVSTAGSSSSVAVVARGSGGSASQQARRLLAAPGALVLFMARAILYVITLRGLIGVASSVGGGGGARAGGGADLIPDEDAVTEAPGGAPVEPGEWEGNPQVAGAGGGAAARKISPLADRGLLLLLVLLHNRRSSTCPTAINAFRAAVASCVDADLLDNDSPPSTHRVTPTSDAGAGSGGAAAAFSAASVSSPAAAGPMRVSFRAMFEAFASTLEASPSCGLGGGGGGGGGGGRGGTAEWGDSVGREGVALLLYSLLQANPGFLRAAVVRSDADALLLPLLRTLHDCASPAASTKKQRKQQQEQLKLRQLPPALYVPAIVVLLFSQDSAFDRQSFRQMVQRDVPWCSTRNLKGASLGSLIVLCVLRCLGHNLSRLKDGYLLENCLAVLINLAPHTEHLQPYAAQRLVSVLVAASRRWIDGASSAAAAATAAAAAAATASGGAARVGVSGDLGTESAGGLTDVQELCGEVARVLFLFVWTCTRPRRLGGNVELLYALLHEQASLDAMWNHPAMAATGWAADLPRLLAHFQDLARQEEEAGGAGLTVETAMKMVEKGVRHYTTEALGMGRDGGGDAAEDGRGGGGDVPGGGGGGVGGGDEDEVITLLYEEGENPEEFFLPYLWELVLSRTPDLNWNSSRVRIFSNAAAGPRGAGAGAGGGAAGVALSFSDDERAPLLDIGRQGKGGDNGGVAANGARGEIHELIAGDMSV